LAAKKLIDEKLLRRNGFQTLLTTPQISVCTLNTTHVYTLGKSGDSANFLQNEEQLKAILWPRIFVVIEQGAEILTYHGPGQIVG